MTKRIIAIMLGILLMAVGTSCAKDDSDTTQEYEVIVEQTDVSTDFRIIPKGDG